MAPPEGQTSKPDSSPTKKKDVEKECVIAGSDDPYTASTTVRQVTKDWETQIAAAGASGVATVIAYPLDFAKSRMQSYGTSFKDTIRDAYRAEGLRAFWRGIAPPLVSVTIVRTVSFTLYEKAKYTCDSFITEATGSSPIDIATMPGARPTLSTILCFASAGAISGATITAVSCPFELAKLSEQLAGKMAREKDSKVKATDKSFAILRRLVRDRGITGAYSGFRLHSLRDTLGTAIYFSSYETVKQTIGPSNAVASFISGGLCGVSSWAVIYPIDSAKTMYQKAILSAGSAYVKRPKIRYFGAGVYNGLGISIARSFLVNATFFYIFDIFIQKLNSGREDEED